MPLYRYLILSSFLLLSVFSYSSSESGITLCSDSIFTPLYDSLKKEYPILRANKLKNDSFRINHNKKEIDFFVSKYLESIPFREEDSRSIYDFVKKRLPQEFQSYTVNLYINQYELSDLIPNIYRQEMEIDKDRKGKKLNLARPIVLNANRPYTPEKGFRNSHLALWASHGWYFEKSENRWIWQRPRLFQIAEDTYTLGYVLPYLVPMLENSGAYVFLPRERDFQSNEIIVDNDDPKGHFYKETNGEKLSWEDGDSVGFAHRKEIYGEGENPFTMGSYRQITSEKKGDASASWTAHFPHSGRYAVYVSYHTLPNSTSQALYTVHHAGGSTNFIVNQKQGEKTWIYLGTFFFNRGFNPNRGSVTLTNKSKQNGKIITADAVKFGGGNGNIGRMAADSTLQPSGKKRYLEGARYWLQWAGFPDSIYNRNNSENEYKDDYMCRPYWVNNLLGGSTKSIETKGKQIPIELAMGFHTDAGQTLKDSIIGTMTIYMSESEGKREFVNGQRRLASRDLADIVQTQIVSDIKSLYRENWTRRKLTDQSYFEARVPEVPTFLLELLSHQNFTDMQYGLDPNFRFHVSRAIYKGLLKFLSAQHNEEYAVHPLPIKAFSANLYQEGDEHYAILKWEPQEDSLEATAQAEQYVLYKGTNNEGWDNGTLLSSPEAKVKIDTDKIYNFRVTAVNKGGESFPSETLSLHKASKGNKTALIINGFQRVSAPESFCTETQSGFLDTLDQGVPDRYDLSYTGSQYSFNKRTKFKNNINPGHGGSHGNYENEVIAGNLFNYPFTHGRALKECGYSFVSCNKEAIVNGMVPIIDYDMVDLILGEEKETVTGKTRKYKTFPKELQTALMGYLDMGGNLFASGAYIASDILENEYCEPDDVTFLKGTLKVGLGESKFRSEGTIENANSEFTQFQHPFYNFCQELNAKQYAVEAPDAIIPANGSYPILTFGNNTNAAAAVAYKNKYKTVISSIPLESLTTEYQRIKWMKEIVKFFESK